MATSFESILDKSSSDIERPKPLPTGTYECVVKGLPRYDKSSKKQTDFVEFTLQPTGTLDDVDSEALEEMGGFSTRTIRATFYITDDAAWRLKKFLDDCEAGEEEMTLRERIEQVPGSSILATIKHRASEDGQAIFAELGGTARMGD